MTALVVSHNEGHLLSRLLPDLGFCDEVIVVDVASVDDTARLAEAAGARVIAHPYATVVELIHPDVVGEARNDLIILPDPDERIPSHLADQLTELARSIEDDVAIVRIPRVFYFRGRPLKGTVWGGIGHKPLVVRRSACEFLPAVHHGVRPRPGFRQTHIPWDGGNAIAHYWLRSYGEFLSKHMRYVRAEGPSRQLIGEITGYRELVKTPLASFRESFVKRKGYLDGFDGFCLSALFALYQTASRFALIRELRHARRAADGVA
jgi:glycosyltransferase involved in cell wall biosynthesis